MLKTNDGMGEYKMKKLKSPANTVMSKPAKKIKPSVPMQKKLKTKSY